MKMGWGTMVKGALLAATLVGCGEVENEQGSPTGTLCFDYFQRCVYPLALDTQLPVDVNNDGIFESVKRCSDSGCHDQAGTSGGGFRLHQGSATIPLVPLSDPANPPPMYVNFISAKGRTDINSARQSPILQKPLVEVSHGGGRVFVTDQDTPARHLEFWISNRVPAGGDEFAPFCATLFAVGNTCQPF